MALPPYVDAQLVHRREDLPLLSEQPDHEWEWRRIAVVMLDGVARDICAGFLRDTGEFGLLGVRKLDYRAVVPLGRVAIDRMRFAARPHPWPQGKKGISLYLLSQHARYVEGHLVRSFSAPQRRRGEASLLAELREEAFGGEQPPLDMDDRHILFYCAATLTARAFFGAQVYGGAHNIDELVGVYEIARTELGDGFGDEDRYLVRDLEYLDGLRADRWNEEAFRVQRHITAVLLALLRLTEWRAADSNMTAA